jgi:hypothetical protein
MKPDVVQDRHAGKSEEIRPEVVVARGIADLIDGQVVWRLPVTPQELMG